MTNYDIKSHSIDQALEAIDRLNAKRVGISSFDYWIDYAVRDWNKYIERQRFLESTQDMINTFLTNWHQKDRGFQMNIKHTDNAFNDLNKQWREEMERMEEALADSQAIIKKMQTDLETLIQTWKDINHD